MKQATTVSIHSVLQIVKQIFVFHLKSPPLADIVSLYAVLLVSCGVNRAYLFGCLSVANQGLDTDNLTTVFHGFTLSVQSYTMPDVIRPRPLPDVFHYLSHSLG